MIDYPARYRSALLAMVRELLDEAAEHGLPGDHAFYLSFRTGAPDVGLSPTLRDVYPETMTIVLQHQFWDLATDDRGFSVTLRFGGRPEPLFIPWDALTSFVDPSAEFGFELPETEELAGAGGEEGGDAARGRPKDIALAESGNTQPPAEAALEAEAEADAEEGAKAAEAEVVSFDRFRDARRPKEPS